MQLVVVGVDVLRHFRLLGERQKQEGRNWSPELLHRAGPKVAEKNEERVKKTNAALCASVCTQACTCVGRAGKAQQQGMP